MPLLEVNGAQLHYKISGTGPETIVFSHGLLMSGEMFRDQVEHLSSDFRCILYDHRGQGQSEVTDNGYDMDSLARDAAMLIQQLDAAPCHFIGLSMGGFVGMRLAVQHPELLRSLILMDTSADAEPAMVRARYRGMTLAVRWFGFGLLMNRLMNLMFGHSFMSDPEQHAVRDQWRRHLLALDRTGTYRAALGVINRDGVFDKLRQITTPTLVLVGEEDVSTVPARSERIQAAIRGAQLAVIPAAGHSPSIEQPWHVTREIKAFIQGVT